MSVGNIAAPSSSRSSMICPVLVNNTVKFDFHVLKILTNQSHRIELGNNKPGINNPDLIIIENKDESITVKKCVSNDRRTIFTRPNPAVEFTVQTDEKYIAYTNMRNSYLQNVLKKPFLHTCIDRKHRDNQDLDLSNLIFKQLYLIRGRTILDIDNKLKALVEEDLNIDEDLENDPDIYLIGDVYKDSDEGAVSGRNSSSTFRYSFDYSIPNDSKGLYIYMVFYLDLDDALVKEFETTYSNDAFLIKLAHGIKSKESQYVNLNNAKINENLGQIFSIFKPLMKFSLTIEDSVLPKSRRASKNSLNSKTRNSSPFGTLQTPIKTASTSVNTDIKPNNASIDRLRKTLLMNQLSNSKTNDEADPGIESTEYENTAAAYNNRQKIQKKRSMLPVKKSSIGKDLSFTGGYSDKTRSPSVNLNNILSTPQTPSKNSPTQFLGSPAMLLHKASSVNSNKQNSNTPLSGSVSSGLKSNILSYVKSKDLSPSSPLDTMINEGMDYTPVEPIMDKETKTSDYEPRTSLSSSAFTSSTVMNDKKSLSERLGIHKVRSLRSVKSALSMKSVKSSRSLRSHMSIKSSLSMFSSHSGNSVKSTTSHSSKKSFASRSIAKIKDSFSISIKQLKLQNSKSTSVQLKDSAFKNTKYNDNKRYNEDNESLDIPTEKPKECPIELPNLNTNDSLQFRLRINYLETYLLNIQPILLQFFKNMELYISFLIDTNNSRKCFIESIIRLKKFLIINSNDEEGESDDSINNDDNDQLDFQELDLNFDFSNGQIPSTMLKSFLQFHELLSKNLNSKSINRYLNRLIESLNSEYQYFDRYIEIIQDTLLKGMQEAIVDSGYSKSESKMKDFINKVNSKIGKLTGNDVTNISDINSDDVLKNDENLSNISPDFADSAPTTSTLIATSIENKSSGITSSRTSKGSLTSILNSADSEKTVNDWMSLNHSSATLGASFSQEFEADKFMKNFIQNKKEYYDTTKDFYHYGSKYLNNGNRISNNGNRISNNGLANKTYLASNLELSNVDTEQHNSTNEMNNVVEGANQTNKRISDNSYRNSSSMIYDETDNIEPNSKDLKFFKKRKNFELNRMNYYDSLNSYKNGSFFNDLQLNLLKFLNGIEQLNFKTSYENKQINLNGESKLHEVSYHKDTSAEVNRDATDVNTDFIQSEKKLQYLQTLVKFDKTLKSKKKGLIKDAKTPCELVSAVNFNILNNGMHYGCKNSSSICLSTNRDNPLITEAEDNFFVLNDDILHQGLLFVLKANSKLGKCWVVLTKHGKLEEYDFDKIDNSYAATAPNLDPKKSSAYNMDALESVMDISFGCIKEAGRKFGFEVISIKDDKKVYQCFSEEEKQLWLRLLNDCLQSSHLFSDVQLEASARNPVAESQSDAIGILGDALVEKKQEKFEAETENYHSNSDKRNKNNQMSSVLNHNQGINQGNLGNQEIANHNSNMFGKSSKDKSSNEIAVNNEITQSFFTSVNHPVNGKLLDNNNGYSVNLNYNNDNLNANDYLNIVRKSHKSNYRCCDCGSATSVEWISISLLVIICIDCSGIHRSLGSHISKIRSLTLDVSIFTPEIVKLLTSVSNEYSNSYWEKKLAIDKSQLINSTSTANERSRFIVDKYKEKKYVPRDDKVNSHLIYGIHSNRVPMILKSLACGGNPNMVVIKGKDKEVECSLLEYALTHYSGTPETPIFEIAELLLLNGAKCGTEVGNSLTLIEKAKQFWQFKIDRSLGINSQGSNYRSEDIDAEVNMYSNFDPSNTASKSFENKIAYNKKGKLSTNANDLSDSHQSQKKNFSSQIPFFSRSTRKNI